MDDTSLNTHVITLITINILVFLLGLAIQVLTGISVENDVILSNAVGDNLLTLIGGFNAYAINAGFVWLLVTANFVHFELFHLAINMYALFVLAQAVLTFYRKEYLLITYVVGGIVSSLATLAVFNITGNYAFSVGASGSIFALLGLLLGGTLKNRNVGTNLPINLTSLLIPIVLTVVFGGAFGFSVNHAAHFGGLGAGFLMGYFLPNQWFGSASNRLDSYISIAYKASIGIIILSFTSLLIHAINTLLF